MPRGRDARGSSEADAELVAAALSNSFGARRRLAERLLDVIQREVAVVLRRYAASVGRDAGQEVRDMVQEVLVSLFEHDARELRRWDPARGRALDSFVRLIARRRVARILGQRRGNPWADLPLDPQTIEDDPAADREATGLALLLEQRNELDAVLDALYARMSERDVQLFEMLFVRELNPGEVAEALGMTRQAVNAWSYRTRKLARSLVLGDPRRASSSTRDSSTKEQVDHG
ncbi:hypothetical protein PPSIR1_17200 [Plesiocystis pacifica SIR-1]|uniref:Uncharacterized protein n=1 Tax=Plesiocystis pacifica SIR-1 TaxID=391625 RepID=A6GHQ4_9BACT|nr:sigma-70 family RNA polymerase sigma factor [Plesiocystis pacifica]EDM74596.1 hypothetical protein PPSIR1_17200 [Plesiocystis pacifica SIR-1]